jgi:hypothetical protein
MNISEISTLMYTQGILGRTPKGRLITEYGVNALMAALSDEKNHGVDAVLCKNCGIIMSSLLIPEGCPNCGGNDMTLSIPKSYKIGETNE